ncbi:uncharacterized protein ndufv3 isoform 2-T2 [Anableps anableps]
MAAWLSRSGRLGLLKFDSWGTLRCYPPAWFCSEVKEPAKKGPNKSEDGRAAKWTYKTTVAFPVKLSDPGVLPPFICVTKEPVRFPDTSEIAAASVTASTKSDRAESLAVAASPDQYQSQEEVSQILAHEAPPVFLPVEEASVEASSKGSVPEVPALAVTIDDVVKAAMVSKLGDSAAEELSSSSSSDSDTDSDSEYDPKDEKLEVEIETRRFSLELEQPIHQEQGEIEEPIVTEVTMGITNVAEEAVQSVVEASRDNSQDSVFEILSVTKGAAELTSSEFSTAAAPTDARYEAPAILEISEKAQSDSPLKAVDVLTDPADDLGDAAEEFKENVANGPVKSDTVSAKVVADHPAEVGTSAELGDTAQVLVEAPGEELHAETTTEQPEESTAAPSEPEEPFDNSTYKNYQHHSYTSYTFADLDVEMTKYRLPQPSSGKPSPRH